MVRAARRVPELRFSRGTAPGLREVLKKLWVRGQHVRLDYGDRTLVGYLTRTPEDHRLVLVRSRTERVGDVINTDGVVKVSAAVRGPKRRVYDATVSA